MYIVLHMTWIWGNTGEVSDLTGGVDLVGCFDENSVTV